MKKIYEAISVDSIDELVTEVNRLLVKYPKGVKLDPKYLVEKVDNKAIIIVTIMVTDKEYQKVKELDKLRETHIIYDNGFNPDGTRKYFLLKK